MTRTVQVRKLSGPPLDWAVAKALGLFNKEIILGPVKVKAVEIRMWAGMGQLFCYQEPFGLWQPSTNWAQGGPIIDAHEISVQIFDGSSPRGRRWNAYVNTCPPINAEDEINGPTALIAAMRCIVAEHLGDRLTPPPEYEALVRS